MGAFLQQKQGSLHQPPSEVRDLLADPHAPRRSRSPGEAAISMTSEQTCELDETRTTWSLSPPCAEAEARRSAPCAIAWKGGRRLAWVRAREHREAGVGSEATPPTEAQVRVTTRCSEGSGIEVGAVAGELRYLRREGEP